ncbi:MAG: low temperature requirement protein A [Ornithinibacter sp.]
MTSDEGGAPGGVSDDAEHRELERHASWAELFFDLVAVAAVASLAHVLATELSWPALGLYAVLFLAVWLTWTTFMLYGNVAGTRTHVLRLLVGMFGLGVMAASVPGVTRALIPEGDEVAHPSGAVMVFAIAYIATRVYGAQSWRRGEVLLDFPVAQHTFGVLPWVISLFTHPPVTIALWALGVALDLWLVLVVSGDDMLERYESRIATVIEREERSAARAPRGGGRPRRDTASEDLPRRRGRRGRPGRPRGPEAVRQAFAAVPVTTDPAHLAERLGLFVIIVLGEGVVQVVNAASEAAPETGLFVAGLASFVLLAGMFGLSVQCGFAGVPHLRGGVVGARAGLALHCVVTGVIATVSVGLASVVEHGNEPLDTGPRWLLCGAVAAYFLIGQLVAIAVSGRGEAVRTLWISSGVVVPVLLALLGAPLPATVVAAVIALVVVGQVVVEDRSSGRADAPDAGPAGPAVT